MGALIGAELPVPPGFSITTTAYDLVARSINLSVTLDTLAETHPHNTPRLAELAATVRAAR